MSRTVLVVEDDDNVAAALVDVLQLNRFDVERVATAATAIERAAAIHPVLVLLDLALPDGSGVRVCRTLRAAGTTPIIVVSARGQEEHKVEALRAGADDYVTKPFGARELLARVEAVLRRAPPLDPQAGETWSLGGGTVLDIPSRRLTVGGVVQDVTRKELDLLVALVRAGGRTMSREELGSAVWQSTWVGESRTLDVHVSALRFKLGDRRTIQTVRGVGYRLGAPPTRLS